MTAPLTSPTIRTWRPTGPLDLAATLRPLRHGGGDPSWRVSEGAIVRAALTPAGPGTIAVRMVQGEVQAQAWGSGADWMLDSLPDLLGNGDNWDGLDLTGHPVLQRTLRSHPGLRLCRTKLVIDSLVPACLEQRVTGEEAFRAYRNLLYRFGHPAPGPFAGLRVPPSPRELLAIPSWQWHRLGVDARRYRAVRAAASVAPRLEEASAMPPVAAQARLQLIAGVGVWTAAEVAVRAWGDPDAVSVGDYHVKNLVGFALTGRPRSSDEEMLELLERWRGRRAWVVRLIEIGGPGAPRYGPRFNYNDIRAI